MDILNYLENRLIHRIGTTSSSPYSGSPTFDAVPFHIEVGKRPSLGTYILIEDDNPEIFHYGRITQGIEENPRADPSRLQQNQAYQVGQRDPRPGDRAPHVTRIMTAELLGEIHFTDNSDSIIKEPNSLTQTGRAVYELPANLIPSLLNTPTTPESGLHLGSVESGGSSVDFMLPLEALARHIAIVGKSGVGKSYATGVFIEEVNRHDIPVVSFDVLGDVINAAEDLHGCNFTAGIDFRVPYSIIGVSEFLNFIPNLTRDQSELVALAYDRVFDEAVGALEQTGKIDIPLQRLLNEIIDVATDFGQEPVGSRAARRVDAAVRRSSLLTTGTEDWLYEIMKKPIINIFLGRTGQNGRNLVVGATARMLQTLRRRNLVPACLFVLDEAHLFLPSGREVTSSTIVIREMIRTARHDAIGIVLITQSPSSLDKQVFLTCNTRLVFALDKDDLNIVAGTMSDVPDEVIARIPKMAKGTAILTSGADIIRHSTKINIRQRLSTREGAPTPNLAEEVKLWRQENQNQI